MGNDNVVCIDKYVFITERETQIKLKDNLIRDAREILETFQSIDVRQFVFIKIFQTKQRCTYVGFFKSYKINLKW